MKRITIVGAMIFTVVGTGLAFTNEGSRRFSEFLNGLKEAPAVVSTTGTGTFRATISRDETEINYVLTFKDLEGDVRRRTSTSVFHRTREASSSGCVIPSRMRLRAT